MSTDSRLVCSSRPLPQVPCTLAADRSAALNRPEVSPLPADPLPDAACAADEAALLALAAEPVPPDSADAGSPATVSQSLPSAVGAVGAAPAICLPAGAWPDLPRVTVLTLA